MKALKHSKAGPSEYRSDGPERQSIRKMSDIGFGRSLKSAAKRKIRKDKEAANEKLLATIPKLSRFGFCSNAPLREDEGTEPLRDDVATESDETPEKTRQQRHVCDTLIESSEPTTVDRTAESDYINVETTMDHVKTGSSIDIPTRSPESESSMTILESNSNLFPTDPAL